MPGPCVSSASRSCSLGVLALSSSADGAVGENWPQWRGPDGRGVSAGTAYPDEWSPDKNIAWKTPVAGRGHSSPVIWGDHIFLTTSIKGEQVPGRTAPDHLGFDLKPGYLHPDSEGVDYKHTLKVLGLDARTGKLAVGADAPTTALMYDNRHRKNTYASSTPVTDGKLVYAFFEAAGLYAYDFNGKRCGRRRSATSPRRAWGPARRRCSSRTSSSCSATRRWATGRPSSRSTSAPARKCGDASARRAAAGRRRWSSRRTQRVELIASGAEMVVGLRPEHRQGAVARDGTSRATRSRAPSPATAWSFFTAGSPAKRAMAIRPGGEGDITDTAGIVWSYNKGTAYVPSPILHGDYLYLMSDGGIMTCLDAKTGEVMYEGGRPPVPATFIASPVAFGDKILHDQRGRRHLRRSRPGRSTRCCARTRSASRSRPRRRSRRTIYIRGEQHLFAIRSSAVGLIVASPLVRCIRC